MRKQGKRGKNGAASCVPYTEHLSAVIWFCYLQNFLLLF
jgi:hypothetical protein